MNQQRRDDLVLLLSLLPLLVKARCVQILCPVAMIALNIAFMIIFYPAIN